MPTTSLDGLSFSDLVWTIKTATK